MAGRIGQQFGNYRLLRLIGRGGFADVYLGEHVYMGMQAAIKVLHSELGSRDLDLFLLEARTIARLEHPHVVRILEFGVEDTTPFLVLSYAPYGTLRDRHPRGTILPLPTVVNYVQQVADALQYAHNAKVIHRDIKPENMLVGRHNEILLSDFGIALEVQSSRYQDKKDLAGTAAYMAPEQIEAHPRPASDQYALGIIVYEWLSGACPFQGTFTEVALKHAAAPPPSLLEKMPALPPAVELVIFTALAKDPANRFASVTAFARALEQASRTATSAPDTSQAPTVLVEGGKPVGTPAPIQMPSTPPAASAPVQSQPDFSPAEALPGGSSGSPPAASAIPPAAISPLPPAPASRAALTPVNISDPMRQAGHSSVTERGGPVTPLPGLVLTPNDLPPPYRRKVPRKLLVSLILLVALILAGSIGGIVTVNQVNRARTRAQATATAIAHNTAIAVTATASSFPYPPNTGQLVLNDPLKDNSRGYHWTSGENTSGSVCFFQDNAYHVIEPNKGTSRYCIAQSTSFSNFVFEVQMMFITGSTNDYGGIVFRVLGQKQYFFRIGRNGMYLLKVYTNSLTGQGTILRQGTSPFIRTSLNATNTLAVVAQGGNLALYVNHQLITTDSDSTYSEGQIGLVAENESTSADVAFSNARVWAL